MEQKVVLGNIYQIGRMIGEGNFGHVRLLVSPQKTIAMKTIDDNYHATNEADILKSLSGHGNVLEYVHHDASPDTDNFFLYTEYIDGVPLEDFIDDGVKENFAMFLFKQLVKGLDFVHQRRICHRDIKPSNLMITDYERNVRLKIIDFGMAEYFRQEDGQEILLDPCVGIKEYLPPEIWLDQKCRGQAFDIWMSGIVLVKMLSGMTPWKIASAKDDAKYQHWVDGDVSLEPWNQINDIFLPLIKILLFESQQQRPTGKEVIQWLDENGPKHALKIQFLRSMLMHRSLNLGKNE